MRSGTAARNISSYCRHSEAVKEGVCYAAARVCVFACASLRGALASLEHRLLVFVHEETRATRELEMQ